MEIRKLVTTSDRYLSKREITTSIRYPVYFTLNQPIPVSICSNYRRIVQLWRPIVNSCRIPRENHYIDENVCSMVSSIYVQLYNVTKPVALVRFLPIIFGPMTQGNERGRGTYTTLIGSTIIAFRVCLSRAKITFLTHDIIIYYCY